MIRTRPSMDETIKIAIDGGLGDCLLVSALVRHFKIVEGCRRVLCAVPQRAVELFDRNPHVDILIPCQGNDLYLWGAPEEGCRVLCAYHRIVAADSSGPIPEFDGEPLFTPNQSPGSMVEQLALHHRIPLTDPRPEIFTDPEDEQWADALHSSWSDRPVVLLNQASRFPQKDIPRPMLTEVVRRLGGEFEVVEMPTAPVPLPGTRLIQPLPGIRRTAALFRRLLTVITPDSLFGHLAAAVGLPAVVLFGPTTPLAFGHPDNINLRPSECPPCADTSRRKACERSLCLEEVTPGSVVDAVFSIAARRVPGTLGG